MASDRCFDGQLWQPHYGDVISVDSRLQIKPLLRARKPRSPQNKDDIFGTVLFYFMSRLLLRHTICRGREQMGMR
jgi:hypothetical protein